MKRVLSGVGTVALLLGHVVAQGQGGGTERAALRGEYSTARAMRLVYGEFDADTQSAAWTAWQGPNYNRFWPDTLQVRILADSFYVDNGVARHLLVTWARPEEEGAGEFSCHACGVLLGVVVLRKDPGGWKVESGNLELGVAGAWGKPPQVKPIRLGDHTWGFAAEMSDLHEGELEQTLWVYGPKDGSFSEWFSTHLIDDGRYGVFPQDDWCKTRESGNDLVCAWRQIDYSVVAEPGKAIYDLVRTRRKPGGVKRDVLRFNGDRFVRLPPQQVAKK